MQRCMLSKEAGVRHARRHHNAAKLVQQQQALHKTKATRLHAPALLLSHVHHLPTKLHLTLQRGTPAMQPCLPPRLASRTRGGLTANHT